MDMHMTVQSSLRNGRNRYTEKLHGNVVAKKLKRIAWRYKNKKIVSQFKTTSLLRVVYEVIHKYLEFY